MGNTLQSNIEDTGELVTAVDRLLVNCGMWNAEGKCQKMWNGNCGKVLWGLTKNDGPTGQTTGQRGSDPSAYSRP